MRLFVVVSLLLIAAPNTGLAKYSPSQFSQTNTTNSTDAVWLSAIKKKKKAKGKANSKARKRKNKHGKGNQQEGFITDSDMDESKLPRHIRREQELAPKIEFQLDEQLGKTKSLKPIGGVSKRPTLTAEDIAKHGEALIESKLDEEIELTQQLVNIETDCRESASARFRLADLYWEKSKRAFFKANDFKTSENERARYTKSMKQLQSTSIASYQTIVSDCPNYDELPKVLYYLGKALMEVERSKEGAGYFKRVIQEYPNSEWVPHSWFMIGEYYFNYANDAIAALKAYTKATEYEKSSMYGYAIYKQGWCFINVGEWEDALKKFKEVVTISEDQSQQIDQRARLTLRKEALKDYVRAYSNIRSSKAALKTFYAIGGKDNLKSMLEQLGNWYINRDAHTDTIVVFRDLIQSYRRSTRLPVWQGRIVDATSRSGNRRQTVIEAKKLTEYFAELRGRVQRNELDTSEKETVAKDVREAEDIAENTLRRLAFEYYKESTKLKGQAATRTLKLAEHLHQHYLEVFPEPKKDAEVNYVFYVRFQYADILYKLENFEAAANNYEQVVEMNPNPTKADQKKIVLVAAEEAVRSYDELVQDLDRKTPPKISGTEPKEIPPVKQKLIDACLRYIRYVGTEGDKIVEIRYKMARIYYTYNHFDKAAPAFNDIVSNHPTNKVACYAANLVLDIYNGRKDYKNLREAARAYTVNKKLACDAEDKERFVQIEESSSFHLIKSEYEDKKRYIAAGDEFMKFYKRFPQSQYADDAVYNAAVNYDLGNKLDKANEVREFLVKTFPQSPLVIETLYNIAQSYERIVDFDNAAKYLEQFASRFPDDKRSKDAIYNAALYRATLGDYAGGKSGRERFIRQYPNDPEIHKIAFDICESLEQEAQSIEDNKKGGNAALAKWSQAHDCYFSYVKNSAYARADTDMLCQAQYRRLEIMRTVTKYEKGANEIKKLLQRSWPNWRKKGIEKLPRCAKAIATIELRDLEGSFKHYSKMSIAELNPTDAGKKKFDASIKKKTKERDILVEEYKQIALLGKVVVEAALTASYYVGEAYRESIEALLQAPIPNKIPGYKLTKEDKQILRNQLKEMADPIEKLAVDAYGLCVQTASKYGVYNRWSVKAFNRLHALRPLEYPILVEHIEPLQLHDKLTVETNEFIIAEGDNYKSIELPLKKANANNETPKTSNAEKPAVKANEQTNNKETPKTKNTTAKGKPKNKKAAPNSKGAK